MFVFRVRFRLTRLSTDALNIPFVISFVNKRKYCHNTRFVGEERRLDYFRHQELVFGRLPTSFDVNECFDAFRNLLLD